MITCYFEKTKKPTYLRHAVVDMLVVKGKKILLVKRGGPLFQLNDNPRRPLELQRQNVDLIYLVKSLKKIGNHDHEISTVKWFDLENLPPADEMAFDYLETIEQYKTSLDN